MSANRMDWDLFEARDDVAEIMKVHRAIMESREPPVHLKTYKAQPYAGKQTIVVQARHYAEAEEKVKRLRAQYFPDVLYWRMWRVDSEPQPPQQTHAQAWTKRKPMGADK